MTTQCTQESFAFHHLGRREVIARFDGGNITSDAGGLLLRETERVTGIIGQFAACFTDHRDPDLIEHPAEDLIAQRIYALALGYEDLNDHDDLRHDALLAVLVGKRDPLGRHRSRERDRGKALAGKSTLNRLELTPVRAGAASRYKKITTDRRAIQRLFTELFLQSYERAPKRIVLDLDATDDPVHGHQSGRFFHGYYKNYCYLPLYIFCGEHLLCARLRPSNIDASAGSVKELERIVGQIRAQWPKVKIVIRGDSGFCREHIMSWCEAHDVDYVLGLAKNERAGRELVPADTIIKPPSAELRPDQFDQQSLPPYEVLDPILEHYEERLLTRDEIIRLGFDEKTTDDLIRKIRISEYKRQQAAPGLKVTSRAFGFGRRMPIAARPPS